MPKKLIYVSGLPRSGSTLLMNLLAQHPDVHSTATSGLHNIMYISKGFFKTEEFKSFVSPEDGNKMFLDYHRAGFLNAYNSLTDRNVVADKSRAFLGDLPLLFKMFPDAKVIVPVRDVRAIVASFEKKYQEFPTFQNEATQDDTFKLQTVAGRAQYFLSRGSLGIALERLNEAFRKFRDKIHVVDFDDLTSNPSRTMFKIWGYVGMKPAMHDFDNVEQYTTEHEQGWPYGDHTIRSSVKPVKEDWNTVLGNDIASAIKQKFKWVTE